MQRQSGDEYIRELAVFVRGHERGLAESGPARRRAQQPAASLFSWLASPPPQAPVLLRTDTHHLLYLLIRLEALGLPVGSIDVVVDAPSRPMSYATIFPEQKSTDALSFTSFRSSLSVVSNFSLAGGWWSGHDSPDIDSELKYIYSSFTKLPALAIGPPSNRCISELMQDPPGENAVPLDAFKNLQRLECDDIDPRTLLGWDRLAESLRSLKIRNSGLQDISVIFIGAVLDDQSRRQGSASRNRHRNIPQSRPAEQATPASPSNQHDGSVSTPTFDSSPPPSQLSPLKWAFLKHLFLPDNGLTFFPTELIPHLTSITHLDLTSNLLVSVPPGLGELYNLISLNLTDNLIDSVLGIYQNLGQVLSLNLSRNRLESLCGLERLLALERIDLRFNLLEESPEIGRLAVLPNITDIRVEGNPFVELEDHYRLNCFSYFWREGKHITLDGSGPTLYEKRNLSMPEQAAPSPPPFVSSSAPVIAVEQPRHISTTGTSSRPESPSPSPSPQLSPSSAHGHSAHRRKKPKRIVDFKADQSQNSAEEYNVTALSVPSSDAAAPLDDVTQLSPPTLVGPAETRPAHRSRHSRYRTEYNPSAATSPLQQDVFRTRPDVLSGSATLASRSEIRRGRVSASLFEPPGSDVWSKQLGTVDDNAETYRRKMELLKRDMGDSWLKVYNQSQAS